MIGAGLIQMTAHMVVRPGARALIAWGLALAALGGILALAAALSEKRRHKARYVAIFLAFALVGAVLAASGARTPRAKELTCCASGPISLEEVAAKYDIRSVDGKLIVLWERE